MSDGWTLRGGEMLKHEAGIMLLNLAYQPTSGGQNPKPELHLAAERNWIPSAAIMLKLAWVLALPLRSA